MRSKRTQEKHTLRICDQQSGKGFDVHVSHHVSLIFNIQVDKAMSRILRCHLI